jgi:hypothetical protein
VAAKSSLDRSDYEDYLVYLYFGAAPRSDYLHRCVDRAYLDFNRTLRGLGQHADHVKIRHGVSGGVAKMLSSVQGDTTVLTKQDAFDDWHRAACANVVTLFANSGFAPVYIGQAQKWINMTFKYIYTMGDRRVPGFERLYSFCHAPIDNVVLKQLQARGAPRLSTAWSRLNDYDEYLRYQLWIRREFTQPALDIEFKVWLSHTV